ncbi:hypothetical protein EMIT0P100_10987 [Pseudomonas sp. IT-P100]
MAPLRKSGYIGDCVGYAREKVSFHKGTPRVHHAKCQLYAKTINTVYSPGFIIFKRKVAR